MNNEGDNEDPCETDLTIISSEITLSVICTFIKSDSWSINGDPVPIDLNLTNILFLC